MTADTPGSSDTDDEPRRIGLFGGTFDPIHHGHLAAAWAVKQVLDLHEVWLVVANDPWQKRGVRDITPARTRLRWVELATEGFEGLVASDVEIQAGGATYTIETIETLRRRHPAVQWSVIVGADVADDLDTWHRADELRHQIEVIVVDRPGSDVSDHSDGWCVRHVAIPSIELSSTQLRDLASAGRQLHFLVPAEVADDIAASQIYALREPVEPG